MPRRHRPRIAALALMLAATAAPGPGPGAARAAAIVAGETRLAGIARMDLTLLDGTPFNNSGAPIVLAGISGYGTITINRDAQVGSTITFSSLSGGAYYGSDPNLGSYVFGNIPPLAGSDFSGRIDNIVQDPGDPGFPAGDPSSFASGDFSLGGDSFGFRFLTGPAAGLYLSTDPAVPFGFFSAFDGLPPSEGTVLRSAGADSLDVLLFNGQVVARTSNRTITITSVPEPGTLILSGLGLALLAATLRRGRRAG